MATTSGTRTQPLLASTTAAGAATATSTAVTSLDRIRRAQFVLKLTATATDGTDTLNVRIQKTPNGGTDWHDFVSFAQIAGDDATPATFLAEWSDEPTPGVELGPIVDGTLAAGNVSQGGALGDQLRLKYVTVSGNSASFTFSVDALYSEDYGGL